nr:MAG TPA: hypothetical protein [Caudoviricetes sp.]
MAARFQSTRPRGARPRTASSRSSPPSGFNPRAREGRDVVPPCGSRLPLGFNPRAREGRDLWCAAQAITGTVSIHAPARGATSSSLQTP